MGNATRVSADKTTCPKFDSSKITSHNCYDISKSLFF